MHAKTVRSLTIGFSVSTLLFLGCPGCSDRSAELTPQLVILMSIDTLRADHLGCYGYARLTSPTIDAFAAKGVLFEDASSPSPWTLPAHGSLLTGLYPSRHGLTSHERYLPSDAVTLAGLMSRGGFETAAVVNSHNLSSRFGLDRGFQKFRYIEEHVDRVGPTSEIIDQALDWLSERPENPLFLFIHSYDVHSDYRALPHYEEAFAPLSKVSADGTTAQLMAFRDSKLTLDDRDAEHLSNLYDAGLRQMDDEIARLFEYLDTAKDKKGNPLWESTVFVLTSDHGEEFLEHGGVLHGRTQYQEVVHVPLIMRGAGIPASTRVATPATLVDVMPTILALTKLSRHPNSANLAGLDLQPLWRESRQADSIRSETTQGERFLFGEADHNNQEHDVTRMVRFADFKLRYNRLTNEAVLHDLSQDPEEHDDASQTNPRIRERLRKQLAQFMSGPEKDAPTITLTPEELERLRTLGYVQ